MVNRFSWLGLCAAALVHSGCGASSTDGVDEASSSGASVAEVSGQRVVLGADFQRNVLTGTSSATRSATALAKHCPGFVGEDTSLFLRVEREITVGLSARPVDDPNLDLVLAMMAPDGATLCVDDAEGMHPKLETTLSPGEYRVWVGGYEQNKVGSFTLEISDILKELPQGPAPSTIPDGTYGGLSIPPSSGPGSLRGRAGGVREAKEVGSGCVGFIASKPDHILFVEETQRLQVSARGNDQDLVLVLQSAEGRVICNDDAEGLSPHLEDELQAGVWNVYVGTFRPALYPDYVLRVSR